ncbi:MAG: ATP-binding protein [Chitinophagaceae bacterium]|nr:ATP-binding protein [Chitinophagaceae bacterium]
MLKKIVIIGPESTGKSTLCEQLAQHYNTMWCPEFAREYLLNYGMDYDYDDLLTIAKGQVELEEEHIQKVKKTKSQKNKKQKHHSSGLSDLPTSRLLFIDTNMYVMKVWCEFVFGKCHPWILEQIKKRKYDLYLLCNTDLPWVKDELREYPDLETRQKLYHIYKNIMISQPVPWVDISGDNEERLKRAVKAVEKLISS